MAEYHKLEQRMKRVYGQAAPNQCYRKGSERVYLRAVDRQAVVLRGVRLIQIKRRIGK